MNHPAPPVVERIVNLLDPAGDLLLSGSRDEAVNAVQSGDAKRVSQIRGQFAIAANDGKMVYMARSIGRPMRYFLAKRAEGPCLIIAERIDEIFAQLAKEGLEDQFHPSYTRMVPAHHLMCLELTGCPDPNPTLHRFFDPQRNRLPADIQAIGEQYFRKMIDVCGRWIDCLDEGESAPPPIGVLFSGGIDSGAVLLATIEALRQREQTPQRVKAFTLRVQSNENEDRCDFDQASQFLDSIKLPMLLESIDVAASEVDWARAVEIVEDYKPLDIQSATMASALCRGIRQRYPDWKYLLDGDGGDENLKDYPIEENPELTIRSVLNNQMLYQEGWGVDAVKHSLVYSGGQSRGHVRTSAPARHYGFTALSPLALPEVIEIAEAIPFIDLCDWDHEKLYALKGEVVSAGVRAVMGIDMPIFEKQRFQHGAGGASFFAESFPQTEPAYRDHFAEAFTANRLKERAETQG